MRHGLALTLLVSVLVGWAALLGVALEKAAARRPVVERLVLLPAAPTAAVSRLLAAGAVPQRALAGGAVWLVAASPEAAARLRAAGALQWALPGGWGALSGCGGLAALAAVP